jgi:hypothetical protein
MPFRGGGVHTIALGHLQPFSMAEIVTLDRLLLSAYQSISGDFSKFDSELLLFLIAAVQSIWFFGF